MFAHIAVGEGAGFVVAVGTIIGYVYRVGRRLMAAAEQNLRAIGDNARINRALAQRFAEMKRTVDSNTVRLDQLERAQRATRDTVEGEIIPRLTDVQDKVTNGGHA